MPTYPSRRRFLKEAGVSAAALPFVLNLPSLGFANQSQRKKRLVVMFSPDGVIPWEFWPEDTGDQFTLPASVKPLEPFKDRTLFLHGVCDKLRGDGDNHMRGIGCLLTGIELFPGNIQGGSHTPAGWASGKSIDQEIKDQLQRRPASHTRFGSLEFGVLVPDRADTWTRMVYAGPNKPIAPIDDPYQMFGKLYGQVKDRESLRSVLDDVRAELEAVRKLVSEEDRRLLDEHTTLVRQMERELTEAPAEIPEHAVPQIEQGVIDDNDNMPRLTKMQIDLLVSSLSADFARVATLQLTNSVGQPKMRWLGIEDGQHTLSHKPDNDKDVVDKLTRINRWYAEQFAYLARRLAETPEPGGPGSLLENTTIVWTNELGKGNSHTLDNIPFVLIGGGLGFKMGRSLKYKKVPHNRLLMSFAAGMDVELKTFGKPELCEDGLLSDLT